MDLLNIQLAHEFERLSVDDLAGNHDGEARRIRNDEVCRYQLGAVLKPLVELGARQLNVLTLVFAVGAEKGGADIAFAV